MPFDKNDPALGLVRRRLGQGMGSSDAYYDVFQPRRGETIGRDDYYAGIRPHIAALTGPFTRCEVQGVAFVGYATPMDAFDAWEPEGMDFLHIHRGAIARFRVYIPADLRYVGNIVDVLWRTPSLTGFKIAGYDDGNNRSDVMIAWIYHRRDTAFIDQNVPRRWLHGMRPPGSTMIRPGSMIGYSEEVPGSSMGTEVISWLNRV